ncbi:endonuclease Q family protein [Aneurinibacillus tyrosinisolvens]|uniref:endonuclease Q family protein n=1 Tax=Aneurinibacillus tyrosinisolvens TaxID=1443435 RepID=UPI001F39D8D7|nr:endonuclease Q family protein [Aneurinibacillus tyrosinisolvens]
MEFMKECFADLHIHVGRTIHNRPVKITASRSLTISSIMEEALHHKGMHMVGVIDCHSPEVQEEIDLRIKEGTVRELPGGGYRYTSEKGEITMIAGVEIELRIGRGAAHFLAYLPDRTSFASFRQWYATKVKNVHLSTQRMYADLAQLIEQVEIHGGIILPAHAFTPHKSIYGACVDELSSVVDVSRLAAIELGLSSDSRLADGIGELRSLTFVTNSDAHSTAKIAREYQNLYIKEANFTELVRALRREGGRCVAENYGLHPQLGKYYRTRCTNCDELVAQTDSPRCPYCGKEGKSVITKGVYERFLEISTQAPGTHPPHRPPYRYHIPLEFIPGLGPGRMKKLLAAFGTEMNILHHASYEQLEGAVGEELAARIERSRTGDVTFLEGGAGIYGKISME